MRVGVGGGEIIEGISQNVVTRAEPISTYYILNT